MAQPERQRSTLRIYVDIVDAVREMVDAKPTHILYRANLSHDRLVKYLEELTGKGLIEVHQDGDNRFYKVTSKGVSFLMEVRKAETFIQGFGISI